MKKKQQRRYPQGVRFRSSCRTLLKVSFKNRTCVVTVTNGLRATCEHPGCQVDSRLYSLLRRISVRYLTATPSACSLNEPTLTVNTFT